ncbi:unnamed protein product [Rhizopus stolonifer]
MVADNGGIPNSMPASPSANIVLRDERYPTKALTPIDITASKERIRVLFIPKTSPPERETGSCAKVMELNGRPRQVREVESRIEGHTEIDVFIYHGNWLTTQLPQVPQKIFPGGKMES